MPGENSVKTEVKTENGSGSAYDQLVEKGVVTKVAEKLQEIFDAGKVTYDDLDERAIDAVKGFSTTEAVDMLNKFAELNLDFVQNKSAYLCGHTRIYKERKMTGGSMETYGPDAGKIKEIVDRTGYNLDVSVAQRKYGGPPPNYSGPVPKQEIFCGNIPHNVFEDELIPLFEAIAPIYELRLMTDPSSGKTRGFCFVKYMDPEATKTAQKELDGLDIKGKKLQLNISTPKTRLYVGNISKTKTKEELFEEFSKHTEGLLDVIIFEDATANSKTEEGKNKNRGFCFLDFEDHKLASFAMKKLSRPGVVTSNSNSRIAVDWADQQEEPDEEAMSKVKTVIVKNMKTDVAEETIKTLFEQCGKIEKINTIRNYSFIFFEEREAALKALNEMNGVDVEGSQIEVALARPPMEKEKHRDLLKKRAQKRMTQMEGRYRGMPAPYGGRGGRGWGPPPPPFMGGRGGPWPQRGGPMRGGPPPQGFMGGRGFPMRPPFGGPPGRGFAGKRKMDGGFGGMSKRGNWSA